MQSADFGTRRGLTDAKRNVRHLTEVMKIRSEVLGSRLPSQRPQPCTRGERRGRWSVCSPPGERQRGVGGAGTCHGGRVSFLGALEQRLVLSLSSGGWKPQRRGQLQDLWGAGPLSLMTVTVGGGGPVWCLVSPSSFCSCTA